MTDLPSPARVRLVTDPREEDELMAICRRLHAENGLFTMCEDKVRAKLRTAFDRTGGLIGVIGAPGSIEAMLCMEIGQLWYSNDYFLNELWNYVLPEYRRSSNAKDLVAFGKDCGARMGLTFMIGILSNIRTEAKVRFYERSLGAPSGAFWVYGAHGNA